MFTNLLIKLEPYILTLYVIECKGGIEEHQTILIKLYNKKYLSDYLIFLVPLKQLKVASTPRHLHVN